MLFPPSYVVVNVNVDELPPSIVLINETVDEEPPSISDGRLYFSTNAAGGLTTNPAIVEAPEPKPLYEIPIGIFSYVCLIMYLYIIKQTLTYNLIISSEYFL
jgi:hypothetical protein